MPPNGPTAGPGKKLGFDLADKGHEADAAERHRMQMAEAGNAADGVFVAAVPDIALVVRAEFHQAERQRRTRKQHPAGIGGAHKDIDVIYGLGSGNRCQWHAEHQASKDESKWFHIVRLLQFIS